MAVQRSLCLPYAALAVLLALVPAAASGGVEKRSERRPLRVLVNSPTIGYSHLAFHGKLADLLVDSGHHVDVFMPQWMPGEHRTATQRANVRKFHASTKTNFHLLDFFQNPFDAVDVQLATSRAAPFVNTTMQVTEVQALCVGANDVNSLQFCIDLVNDETVMSEFRRARYDVFVGEMFDPCMFYAAEVLGIKTRILTSALSMPDEIAHAHGIPVPRSYIPSVFGCSANVPVLSWMERFINIIIDAVHPYVLADLTDTMRSHWERKFDVKLPSFRALLRSTSYIFVNVHDHFDHPRPITRKIQYIGGLAIKQPAPQHPARIEAILRMADRGVILFAMGSIIDTQRMPQRIKEALVNAFARFPQYEVIARMTLGGNDTALFNRAPNLHVVDWFDQPTLLADSRTRLMISHCGQNSALETAYYGVPVLATPLFADMNYNAALLVRRGMALHQHVSTMSEESLVERISELLNNPSYQENASKIRRKMQDEPFPPGDRFVRLVEYAAAHDDDANDLGLYVTELSWLHASNLDIYVPLLLFACVAVLALVKGATLARRGALRAMALSRKLKMA